MNKKVFVFSLSLFTMFAFFAKAEVKTYVCGDSCTATLDENGVMHVSGTGEMYGYDSTTRYQTPWFADRASIKSVVIDKGVTEVGRYAFFACHNLKNIELSSTVAKVNTSAFDEDRSIQTITAFASTVWSNQENMNDNANSPQITFYCKGNSNMCEANFMKYGQHPNFQGINMVRYSGKRIYSVEEAAKLSKPTGNKIMIRYK